MIVECIFIGGKIFGKKVLKIISKSDMKGEKRLINFRKKWLAIFALLLDDQFKKDERVECMVRL